MNRRLGLLVLVFLLLGISVNAQQQNDKDKQRSRRTEDDVVRLSTTLVQVDAIVTDRDGKHVTNLRPEDFQVFQDGKPQKITNFSYVNVRSKLPSTDAGKSSSAGDIGYIPPTNVNKDQIRRTIAVVVDNLTDKQLSASGVTYVRNLLHKFVDEQMQPGDLVGIFRTDSTMGGINQFTSDKQELHTAINRIYIGRFYDGDDPDVQPTDCKDSAVNTHPDLSNFTGDSFMAGTMGDIEFIVNGMRDLPGRKSVLIFSEGFALDPCSNFTAVEEVIRRIVNKANRSSVVIYAVDPRGLPVGLGPQFSAKSGPISGNSARNPGSLNNSISVAHGDIFNSPMRRLTDATGGLSVHNTNDLFGGLKRILTDQEGYYLIGYQPDESTFDPAKGGRKFHQMKVEVKQSGLIVRARSGFQGVTDAENTPQRITKNDQLQYALTTPFISNEIPIKMTGIFGNDAAMGSMINVLIHVEATALSFSDDADGSHKASVDIVAATFGNNGIPVDQIGRNQIIEARGQAYEKMKRDGLLVALVLPVKKSGPYQLHIAVRDVASERVGSASQFIVVPNLNKGLLALSGIVAVGSDQTDAQASAALRHLKVGMNLEYTFSIYNSILEPASGRPRLKVEARVQHDGKLIWRGQESVFEVGSQTDLKRLLASGSMKIGPEFSPGEYVLQVIVTDQLANAKNNKASKWITFEIVK